LVPASSKPVTAENISADAFFMVAGTFRPFSVRTNRFARRSSGSGSPRGRPATSSLSTIAVNVEGKPPEGLTIVLLYLATIVLRPTGLVPLLIGLA
jgi:hypothetical protein